MLKKSWGHRFRDGPNPVTSVELVEAFPAETAARNASPLRWLGDSPEVPVTRLYPLVPPLPVLEDFTLGPPPFRGRRKVAGR